MHFLTLLRGGATPKFAAEAFLDCLYKRSSEECDLCWEVTANFIMDCFAAINLNVTITADEAESGFRNFQWPIDSLRIYVFKYNKTTFTQFELFLYEFCILTRSMHQKWFLENKEELTENYIENYMTPLELSMQLIAAWHSAYKYLVGNPEFLTYFEEPLSRINFQLLRGVTYLRIYYHREMPILDSICDRLLRTAQLGTLYPESHHEVLTGLLTIFIEDFHKFYKFSPSSTDFYYRILTTKCPKTSYVLVYKNFIELLHKYGINFREENSEHVESVAQQYSLMVTNFLVDTKMINIYYHGLTKKDNKAVVLAVLEFLNVLQSKLISLDCFSEAFMEGILALVLWIDLNIGNLAAKLYVTIMKRRSDADSILKHILGFYYVQQITPDVIPRYVQRLWKYFRPMQNINYYVESLDQRSIEAEPARIVTAHFVVVIFKRMLRKYGLNDMNVINFLQKSFDILKQVKCQITQGILLDIFDSMHIKNLENEQETLKEVYINFEEYVHQKFLSWENIQYPLLKKWFLLWETFALYTGNLNRLQEISLSIVMDYGEFRNNTPKFFEKANRNNVRKYCGLLRKLCLLTQSNCLTCDNQSQILNDLQKGLMKDDAIQNGVFYSYALKFKALIDVYALEIYTISLIKMFHITILSPSPSEYEWLVSRVYELETHLCGWIRNAEDVINQPIVRIKTFLICFFELHLVFGSDPTSKILKINLEIYEIIVRIMVSLFFKNKFDSTKFEDYDEDMQVHPQRSVGYQRLMLERFDRLHQCRGIELSSHYVWHFCLYYGLPQSSQFQNELQDFMQTLARYRFRIYQRVIPIIIFNLYKHQPALNTQTILKAIKTHKNFIDNLMTNDRALMNVHVVISVIERLNLSLKTNSIDKHRDRLAPLKHLYKFIENLDLHSDGGKFIRKIYDDTNDLRRNLLSTVEIKTIEEFLANFNDEINLIQENDNNAV